MKRIYIITVVCVLLAILLVQGEKKFISSVKSEKEHMKVGFLYVGDSCDTYTNNFIKAQKAIENEYGDRVIPVAKYNVAEGTEEKYLRELVDEGCELIFATSYGYGETVKAVAAEYPNIQFCMATGDNANTDPVLPNFHNYMGEIYQGRYITGVVAGMKLAELIENGEIKPSEAKIGYVGAFPYAEVISGYTAFFLGVRSVVPDAEMTVIYTNSWGDYDLEKHVTERLIKEGCVIISQHSDTSGPAVACEELRKSYVSYHVGYNQSMTDVAPTTSLISSRINWQHYMVAATGAVLNGKRIESNKKANIIGNDMSGGFRENWVQLLKLNETIAAPGTQAKIDELVRKLSTEKFLVFQGDYIGVDPFNPEDTIDLNNGYAENSKGSAPSFHYVLQDVITIEE